MIYTVTFNPSLDYIFTVDEFKMGNTNRTTSEEIFVGGKGINVSIVLNNLGYKSTALGFIGGFTGEEIKRRIEQKGISTDFIKVHDGFSRINLKLISHDGTEINGNGARISKEDLDKLFIRIENIKNGDLLILAGSVPKSIDQKIYSQILDKVSSKNILVSVDATNQLLLNTLKYEPFLIKPNKQELEQIFDTKIEKEDEIISYAKKLKNMEAKRKWKMKSKKAKHQKQKAGRGERKNERTNQEEGCHREENKVREDEREENKVSGGKKRET